MNGNQDEGGRLDPSHPPAVPEPESSVHQDLGRLIDWDGDDSISETGKSTSSSNYPFGSPNPSDLDEHGNMTESADRRRKKKHADGSAHRPAYPMSERQQMALLKQITKPEQGMDSPKSPTQTPGSARSRGRVARVHRRNDRGETPLHTAARKGDHRQCKKLLQEGADVNCVDYAGWTSLHEACNHGWYKVAKILIAYGADVNASGLDDDTPLHDAAYSRNIKLVHLLVRSGAERRKMNKSGQRAMDIAEDDEEIKKLLCMDPVSSPHISSGSGTGSDRDSDHGLAPLSPSHFHHTPSTQEKILEEGETPKEEKGEEKEEGEITDDTDAKEEEEEEDGEMKSVEDSTEEEALFPTEDRIAQKVEHLKIVEVMTPSVEEVKEAVKIEEKKCPSRPARMMPSDEVFAQKKLAQQKWGSPRSPRLGSSPVHSATAAAVKSLRKRDMIFRKRHQLQQQQQESARKKRRAEMKGRKRKLEERTGTTDVYDFHSSESEQDGEKGEPRRLFHAKNAKPDKVEESGEAPGENLDIPAPKRLGMTRKERLLREISAEEGGTNEDGPKESLEEGQQPKVPPLRIILPSTSRSASDDEGTADNTAPVPVRPPTQPYVFRAGQTEQDAVSEAGAKGSGNSSQDGGEKSQRLTRSQLRAGRGQLEAPPPAPVKTEEGSGGGSGLLSGGRGPRKPWGVRGSVKPLETPPVIPATKSHWTTSDSSQTSSILKKNSYEAYRDLRHIVEEGWRMDNSAQVQKYIPPENYKNFLISKKTYLLEKSRADDAPQEISAPQTLAEPMLSLFRKQETQRHELRCQHKVERERLTLVCEKDILRSQARQTKASFLTAARVMGDAEIYNPLGLEKHHGQLLGRDTNSSSGDDLEAIKSRFKQKKLELINRQKMEGISLQSSQLMTWEAQMKKAGLVEPSQWHKLEKARKKTAVSVPLVQVLEDFHLLPSGYGV